MLLAMGATGQCLVRRHVIQTLGLGAGRLLEALSSCGTGQSGATPDSPVPLWPTALTSAAFTVLHVHCQSRPLRADDCCSACSPDSPVAHRTVRWIIAEVRLGNLKVKTLKSIFPGAPNTIRWHTEQSGAPDQGALRFPLLFSSWTLFNLCIGFELNLLQDHLFTPPLGALSRVLWALALGSLFFFLFLVPKTLVINARDTKLWWSLWGV
jgi:hypothetical protein